MLNVASMKERIKIEKLTSTVDSRGNPVETWTEIYTCWANAATPTGDGAEFYGARMPLYENKVRFTIRYTSKLKNLDTSKHRVIWNEREYNLLGVDNIYAKNEKLILTCITKDNNKSLEGDAEG